MQKEKVGVYLYHGDAKLLAEEALASLVKELLPENNTEFNYDMFDADTTDVTHVLAAANTLPVFAERRLVVVRRVEKYLEGKKVEEDNEEDDEVEALLQYACNPNPQSTLVLAASRKLDGRRKSYKALSKHVNVKAFNELQYKDITNWLISRAKEKYHKKLNYDAAQFLFTVVGKDTSMLASELEKTALFCAQKEIIALDDVKVLAADDSNIVIFDFIDALTDKKPQKAMHILQELIRRGEYPAKILVILAGQLRSLLSVKALKERGSNQLEIAKTLGSKSEYAIQKYLRQEKHFTTHSLCIAFKVLSEADTKTKMGMGDAENLLLNAVTYIATLVK